MKKFELMNDVKIEINHTVFVVDHVLDDFAQIEPWQISNGKWFLIKNHYDPKENGIYEIDDMCLKKRQEQPEAGGLVFLLQKDSATMFLVTRNDSTGMYFGVAK